MESGLAIARLLQSLDKSMKELSLARMDSSEKGAYIKYAELTGRLETMRTIISYFQQTAQEAPAEEVSKEENPPPKGEKAVKAS